MSPGLSQFLLNERSCIKSEQRLFVLINKQFQKNFHFFCFSESILNKKNETSYKTVFLLIYLNIIIMDIHYFTFVIIYPPFPPFILSCIPLRSNIINRSHTFTSIVIRFHSSDNSCCAYYT